MPEDIVVIDETTINALDSSTRRIILKKIKHRPMTVSELGRDLSINKSAIFKHLQILQNADLITKRDTDNEFVYYTLTIKGDGVLETDKTNNKKIFFILSTFLTVFTLGLLITYSVINRAIVVQYWDKNSSTIDTPLILIGFLLLTSAVIFLILEVKKNMRLFKNVKLRL